MLESEMFIKLVLVVAILWSGSRSECEASDNITDKQTKTIIPQDDSNLSVLLTTAKTEDKPYLEKSESLDNTTVPSTEVRNENENQTFTDDEQANETSSRHETTSNKPSNNTVFHNEADVVENTVKPTTSSTSTTTTTSTTSTTTSTTAPTTISTTTSTTIKTYNTTASCSDCTTVPDHKQNDTPVVKSFNLNYLYFLLLIIPIACLAIGIHFYKKRKHQTKNAESTTKYKKPRRFSTPSWVFSEPDDADEEVITLEEEKRL